MRKTHNLKVSIYYTIIILLFSIPIMWGDYLRMYDIKNTSYDLIIKALLTLASLLLVFHHHINTGWLYGLRICCILFITNLLSFIIIFYNYKKYNI